MELYCKKDFQQFKVGDKLPNVQNNVGMQLVAAGLASQSKPKTKTKKKANASTK